MSGLTLTPGSMGVPYPIGKPHICRIRGNMWICARKPADLSAYIAGSPKAAYVGWRGCSSPQ